MDDDIGAHPRRAGVPDPAALTFNWNRMVVSPKIAAVYIVASKARGTLYTGVTSNLVKRIWQHREGAVRGFTSRHGIKRLVWYEQHATMIDAIRLEKAIKLWPRQRKIDLIRQTNPEWRDLWPEIPGTTMVAARPSGTPARWG